MERARVEYVGFGMVLAYSMMSGMIRDSHMAGACRLREEACVLGVWCSAYHPLAVAELHTPLQTQSVQHVLLCS